MKQGFYLRLALDGMRKNKRLYLPYLLTCSGMVTMFYILSSLSYSPLMKTMRGGNSMSMILTLGTFVIALFALLFLFYTNAFLARRRNREFGLYNILGMNKQNLARILLWETLLSAVFALVVGLACGLLFSKLAELFLLHMAREQVGYAFYVEPKSILAALTFFGAIFALILIVSVARVGISKPLDLLKSETAGEKPPKANWLFALAGVAILGAAYYLAVTIDEPMTAVFVFFIAVLMVIVATYLLFIAGSVVLCKLLQKKKSYYYKSAHFVSVSSMAFRMKRNGAGLASICILATMVLVMLSSTSCLYFGGDDALHGQCPYDMMARLRLSTPASCTEETLAELRSMAQKETLGREEGMIAFTALDTSGYFENGTVDLDGVARYVDVSTPHSMLERIRSIYVLPLADYNRLMGTDLALSPGEALIWSSGEPYEYDTFTIKGCRTLRVNGALTELPMKLSTSDTLVTAYFVVVPDWEDYATEISVFVEKLHQNLLTAAARQYCYFDLPGVSDDEQIKIGQTIYKTVSDQINDGKRPEWIGFGVGTLAGDRSDFFGTYGSLFFIGIILSIAFIAAAALIIYYKQLSEGYEDQRRFGIMQKVGMTKREIKSTVDSQVLTVFFAPLLFAGLHLAFAFPFVEKIVHVFGVTNRPLLILTNIVCFFAFTIFYVFVYRETAKAYYAIVSNGEERR
ncbi:MAG: ABC transporter permease [Ruminococcaceae bacterium]|nr:ABC transporter permease [Oscillospiraceae bacterium]